MELGFTILSFIFMYIWFSNCNFISFIFLLSILNMTRNVRIYMLQNNIIKSSNPFLNCINYIFNGISWISSKVFNNNSYLSDNISFIKYLNNKYNKLNNDFLEVLAISKHQILKQLSCGFNYTLTTIVNTNIDLKQAARSEKSNKEMIELSNEFKKRNSVILNLNNQIMPTLTNIIESINKLKEYKNIEKKDLEIKKNIYLYDSDHDNDHDNDHDSEHDSDHDSEYDKKEKVE